MFRYYTAIIFISIVAMTIIQVSISKSWTLARKKKILFHLLFSAIAVSAFCEWMGVYLQGSGSSTRIFHIFVKAVELSVAPSIGVFIASVIEEKRKKLIWIVLGIHAVIEWISGIGGVVYYVDANSNYNHGEFYLIYILAYLMTILYAIFIIIRNIRKYQYGGITYFLLVVAFMIGGIVIQSVDSELKVDYVVLALSATMLYIFTLEMIQQTDELTELINRRGYENFISHLDERCAIIFFDMDKFKEVNDGYGHDVGDICIGKTGRAIKKIYSHYGKCFRFGGDEFCVILTRNIDGVEKLNKSFMQEMARKRQQESRLPYISIGYSYYDPENGDVEAAIKEADKSMYQYKQLHRTDR